MLTNITNINDFEQILIKNSQVVLYFSGLNCGACTLVDPIVNQVVKKNPNIDFVKILTDDSSMDPLIHKYSISSIPYFIFLKNEKIVATMTGYQPVINFENKINEFFDND